jgi:hypothetical protein
VVLTWLKLQNHVQQPIPPPPTPITDISGSNKQDSLEPTSMRSIDRALATRAFFVRHSNIPAFEQRRDVEKRMSSLGNADEVFNHDTTVREKSVSSFSFRPSPGRSSYPDTMVV